MQTIYLDVLIGVNIYINYILLVLTARFSLCRVNRKRLVISSLVGALSSCTILLDVPYAVLSIAIKLVTVILMTIIAFEINSWRMLLKLSSILTAVTFGFAGAMIGIKNLASSENISVSNFSVYLDISPLSLIFLTLVCYVILTLFSKISPRKTQRASVCRVTISNEGKSVTLDGLLDTGNRLTEPFSGLPVMIVNEKSIYHLLPADVKNFDTLHPRSEGNVRLIPYDSVGGSGLLAGFMPEGVTVERDGTQSSTKNVYIAVADRDTDIPALVNPDIL